MACGTCGQKAAAAAAADEGVMPTDTDTYLVGYDNGFSEEVVGIATVRARVFSPETRPEQARDAGPMATYKKVE